MTALVANLESGFVASIQKVLAVKGGCGCNAVDLGLEGLNFGVKRSAVAAVHRAVGRLDSQFTNTLKHVGDFFHGAFCSLSKRHRIVGVFNSHGQTTDLGCHAAGNGQAGGVVCSTVNLLTRRELGHRAFHVLIRLRKIILGIQRRSICINRSHNDLL